MTRGPMIGAVAVALLAGAAFFGIRHYRKERQRQALVLAVEARASFEQGDLAAAERKYAEAARLLPDSVEIRQSLANLRGAQAFSKKDYAGFLAIAEEGVRHAPGSWNAVALLASALSAQYAATGDAAYKARAEEALEKARRLSDGNAQALAMYQEYSDRIRHRLDTREILERAEYDRRFRGKSSAP